MFDYNILETGNRIDRSGYWYILCHNHPMAGKQKYYAEHRLVMEKKLGRFLDKNEVVHHKNGDTKDNRLENLELFSSPGEHTKIAHPEVTEKARKVNKGVYRGGGFIKGHTPWNKGKVGVMPTPWNKNLLGYNSGDKHPQYRKDKHKIKKKCLQCSIIIKVKTKATYKETLNAKYCSYKCYWKSKRPTD